MKPKPPCERCGRPYSEHEISVVNGTALWLCPQLKGTES